MEMITQKDYPILLIDDELGDDSATGEALRASELRNELFAPDFSN